jgi:hypothetical protein
MARGEPAGRAELGEPIPERTGRSLLPELDREERSPGERGGLIRQRLAEAQRTRRALAADG